MLHKTRLSEKVIIREVTSQCVTATIIVKSNQIFTFGSLQIAAIHRGKTLKIHYI